MKKLDRKKLVITAIALGLILVLLLCVFLPGIIHSAKAAQLLKDWMQAEELVMDLTVQAQWGDQTLDFSAVLQRSSYADHIVTAITRNGMTLCYTQGAVILPNGQAYKLGLELDHTRLPALLLSLYQNSEITFKDHTYTAIVNGEDAQTIAALLLQDTTLSVDSLNVTMTEESGTLTQLHITAQSQELSLDAALTVQDDAPVPISEPVKTAIDSGVLTSAEDISEDLWQLLTAWSSIPEPMTAMLSLKVDCGPLAFTQELQICRWQDPMITAVKTDNFTAYFNGSTVCDEHGNSLFLQEFSVESAELMDIIWQLCLTSQLTFHGDTCVMKLGEEEIAALAYAIVPQTQKLNVTFTSGTVVMELDEYRLERVSAVVNGFMQVLNLPVPVSLEAVSTLLDDGVIELPQAVLEKLG